jgi:DNA mismatch endonuclease (patch repair protein)
VDVVSPEIRSRMMSGIRGRNTCPELLVRSHLHRKGLRFSLAPKSLPGRPDVVLPKWGAVVLVHGCFWHGHAGCKYFRLPSTRPEFWKEKLFKNVERDSRVVALLKERGWRIAVVWECSLRNNREATLAKLVDFVVSARDFVEFDTRG